MTGQTRNLILGAMFTAAGVLLPVIFHTLGLGAAFLPMFWPIAVAGFFLSLPVALLTGALTPILSFVLTAMPPPPILYRMIVELAVLSGSIALLRRSSRIRGTFWITALGLFSALIAGLGGAALIAPLLGLPPAFYAAATLIRGIPGIAAILILVPLIMTRLRNVHPDMKESHGES
jgi:uncharacterized membrane protein YuzA (DUF378 family)